MKKFMFMAATAALALSSCSSEEELVQGGGSDLVDNGAVMFSAYTARNTRAYDEKDIKDLDNLKDDDCPGFGVFAYEQGRSSFSTFSASTSYPNFMYNQTVKWNGTDAWEYAPIKYYSNNEGAKHSFFAYAPARGTGATPVFSLGKAPQIRYNVRENYDLLWSAPVLDKEKAGITEKITFNFKHALSKVSFHVAPFIDMIHTSAVGGHASTNALAAGTKVTVKSIRFVGNVPSQALLNLQDGKWTIENTQEGEYLVNVAGLDWNAQTDTSDPADDKWDNLDINGYKNALDPIKVIPSTGVKVEIVYDVETRVKDATSTSNDSKVTNTVVSKEEFNLESGKAIDFYLDLGLTSVKFDAKFTDWSDGKDYTVDLPNNHDFHAMSYVSVTTAPTSKTFVATSDMNTCTNIGNFAFDNGVLKSCKTAYVSSPSPVNAVWEDAADGEYRDATSKIYIVKDGVCSVFDFYYLNGKYYDGSSDGTSGELEPTALISLTPNSDGYVQKTTGEWIAPQKDAYYTVGSFLYKWVATTVPAVGA